MGHLHTVVSDIALDLIDDNPFQTRTDYSREETLDLAASIRTQGLLQFPVARVVDATGSPLALDDGLTDPETWHESWRVQLAFGHRRKRAFDEIARLDGRTTMPIMLRSLNDEQMFLAVMSENMQRREISALDEARAIVNAQQKFGWSDELLASKLGYERTTVAKKRRFVEFPRLIQDALQTNTISIRQAYAMIPFLSFPPLFLERFLQFGGIYQLLINKTPDEIQAYYQTCIRQHSIQITVDITETFAIPNIRSARCMDCSHRISVNRQRDHRCMDSACHYHKSQQHQRSRLQSIAKATQVPSDIHATARGFDPGLPDNAIPLLANYVQHCPDACLSSRASVVPVANEHGCYYRCSLPICRCEQQALADYTEAEQNKKSALLQYLEMNLYPLIDELVERLHDDVELWCLVAHNVMIGGIDPSVFEPLNTIDAVWRKLLIKALMTKFSNYYWHQRITDAQKFVIAIKTTFALGLPTLTMVMQEIDALDAMTVRWSHRDGYQAVRPSFAEIQIVQLRLDMLRAEIQLLLDANQDNQQQPVRAGINIITERLTKAQSQSV